MATDYIVKTHKIEVHLHKHGDSEEAAQRFKDEYRIWDEESGEERTGIVEVTYQPLDEVLAK